MAHLEDRDAEVLMWFLAQLSGQLRGYDPPPEWAAGMLGTFRRNGLIDSEEVSEGQDALEDLIARLRVGLGEPHPSGHVAGAEPST